MYTSTCVWRYPIGCKACTMGVIEIILGVLIYSGLMLSYSVLVLSSADHMIELTDSKLYLTVFLIALASLFLGLGVPLTAAYLITALVTGPAFFLNGSISGIALTFLLVFFSTWVYSWFLSGCWINRIKNCRSRQEVNTVDSHNRQGTIGGKAQC